MKTTNPHTTPTTSAVPTLSVTEQKPPKGLFLNWQIVDGKLTSTWLQHPD